MKQTFTKLLCAIFLLTAGMASAQTPFWTEDFSDGIPAGWGNADESGQNVLWTWCANPALGDSSPGCPEAWDDSLNGQTTFQATTADNGFATLDSDDGGELAEDHISQLTTSAINCTGKSSVYVRFDTHLGTYQHSGDDLAILRVSTDNVNWTSYQVFSGIDGNSVLTRWSANPERPVIDISATAANAATVYIQWQWTGNYDYHWNIDDIGVYSENPIPKFDLTIGEFFYSPASFATPVSQIATDTFGFFATVSNEGGRSMTNVVLTASVLDENANVLFADSITVPELASGVTDSAIVLPNVFVPDLNEGVYFVIYEIHADSTDLLPDNNADGAPFVVTENVFSKENEPQLLTRTSQDIPWNVGNYYRIGDNTLEQYKASVAEFAFGTDPDELAVTDVTATVYLFKVNDDVDANFDNFDDVNFPSSSLEWVGYASYEAADTVLNGDLQDVELLDFNTSEPGVVLQPGGRYFLMAGYGDDVRQTNHAFNTDIRYFNQVSTVLFTDRWYLAGFGPEYAAVMRMYLDLVVKTDDKPLPETAFNVLPNPVRETLHLAVQFDQPTDATITIADLSGRVITYQDRQGLTNEVLDYNLSYLPNGAYLARIATKEGTKTKKFVIQK